MVAAWHVGLSAARKRPSRIKFAAPRTSSPTYRGGCRNNTPPGVAFRVSHIAYSSAQRKGASLAVSVDRFGLGNLFLQLYTYLYALIYSVYINISAQISKIYII